MKYVSPINRKLRHNNQHFSISGNRTYDVNLDSFDYFVPLISDARMNNSANYLLSEKNTTKMILVYENKKSSFDIPNITQMDMSNNMDGYIIKNNLWIQNDSFSILIKFHYLSGKIDEGGKYHNFVMSPTTLIESLVGMFLVGLTQFFPILVSSIESQCRIKPE